MLQGHGEIIFNSPRKQTGPVSWQPHQDTAEEEGKKEGRKEAFKEEEKEAEKSHHKIEALIKKSQKPLIKITSIFPLTLSPVSLVVEVDRVNITFNQFLGTYQMRSVPIKNLGEVVVETGPLFATLRVLEARMGQDTIIEVKPVRKRDAVRARRVLHGLMVADKNGVDLTVFEPEELARKVEILGQATEAEAV